ncbi:MAG: hypothetical protein K2M67_02040 [Muribaculaceae bacterium]|nr:hypothetical protein [Muribaculaceae bacterium]
MKSCPTFSSNVIPCNSESVQTSADERGGVVDVESESWPTATLRPHPAEQNSSSDTHRKKKLRM